MHSPFDEATMATLLCEPMRHAQDRKSRKRRRIGQPNDTDSMPEERHDEEEDDEEVGTVSTARDVFLRYHK